MEDINVDDSFYQESQESDISISVINPTEYFFVEESQEIRSAMWNNN